MTAHRKPSAILRAIGERIGRPERWTQGRAARDADGKAVMPVSIQAVCWCLEGALLAETDPRNEWPVRCVARSYLHRAIGSDTVGAFNDTHTHAEVLAANARAVRLAEEAGE